MDKTEWKKVLEAEVEKRFNPADVDGFENSAPSIKLGILGEMYEEDEVNGKIEQEKELAYGELASEYETMGSWN